MRFRTSLLIAAVSAAAVSSVAIAAVAPKPATSYFYLSSGRYSITLVTKTATRIAAGRPGSLVIHSDILIVCRTGVTSPVTEMQVGFPGAKLKLTHGHYGFTRAYTWKHPLLNIIASGGQTTHRTLKSARVTINGTVASPKLIKGSFSVTAKGSVKGCALKSTRYRAATGLLKG